MRSATKLAFLLPLQTRTCRRRFCLARSPSSSGCLPGVLPPPPDPTTATPASPVDPATLLRVCTVLYQQQDSPDERLHARLDNFHHHLSHEFFLQVCNKFPYSWRPVHRLFRYSQIHSSFVPTPVAINKVVDVLGKAQNIQLLWDFLRESSSSPSGLVNARTLQIAGRALAGARQIKKCAAMFDLVEDAASSLLRSVETLNGVVEELCRRGLPGEARDVVARLKQHSTIRPDATTYGLLIAGFCRKGDMPGASKLWNTMVEDDLDAPIAAYEAMIEAFFKNNRPDDAIRLFKSMRTGGGVPRELALSSASISTYRIMISWMCREGNKNKADLALGLLGEMTKTGVEIDGEILGAVVYGLVCWRRVAEGYRFVAAAAMADEKELMMERVYHGLMKGLLRLRRARDATQVFREMSQRGCEPTMHTYIMLLQGHMGKRGRKGREGEVDFESIFVGGMVKHGRTVDAAKYLERAVKKKGRVEVPRFDYNKFLRDFSNEGGVVMFKEIGRRLREAGMVDLGDIFLRFGEKMATRSRRRNRMSPVVGTD